MKQTHPVFVLAVVATRLAAPQFRLRRDQRPRLSRDLSERLLVRLATVALVLAWTAPLPAQEPDSILPYEGGLALSAGDAWPEVPPGTDQFVVELVSTRFFPPMESCFLWDSTRTERHALRVTIRGRHRCPEPTYGISENDSLGDIIRLRLPRPPLELQLVLPRARATVVFEREQRGNITGVYARFIAPDSGITLPRPFAWVAPRTAWVHCSAYGYGAICQDFVRALIWLAQLATAWPSDMSLGDVVPPFRAPSYASDSAARAGTDYFVELYGTGNLDSLLRVSAAFTGVFRWTNQGNARVQITTAERKRYICADGRCDSADLNTYIP